MKKWHYIFFIFLVPALSNCERGDEFPNEPVITAIDFDDANSDLIIEFTDGDGDYGIEAEDPDFPYYLDDDSTEVNPYYFNLWIDYYELRDGEWVFVEPKSEAGFNFRVPNLTPDGQNKQLEVIFTNDMSTELPYLLAESDTIKFRVTLVDRAKNESVPEETSAIYMPR